MPRLWQWRGNPVRALVTGAAGFVGQYLVAHLCDSGDEVVETDRSHGGPDVLDADALLALVADAAPEVVFHLAGQADVGRSWTTPAETLRVNVEGTFNVLVAAREAGVSRVVTVTSADVYGAVDPIDLPISESVPLRPVSPYAVSKAAADMVAEQAHLGFGQDVVRARSFNHLGPGQSDRFVCPAIASRIAANELSGDDEVPVGDLTPLRDFSDVRDVVRAYRMLAVDGRAGVAYNVCSGMAVPISDVAEHLVALATRPMRLVPDPELFRPVEVPELCGDSTVLQADTGWEPRSDLSETLADVMADWRTRVSSESQVPPDGD
ncbi:MAG TPA: GDP-mannose 4,6-dehydratase [Acidimicrobiaceae bacterium]|nr:GDP-mannose 4,6-dehydratase [Acidimicrobiaceae bacterium]HCV36515.1 GDP-mannose 4,6-dehydratase [Acidimicrobiaceae bacterium]